MSEMTPAVYVEGYDFFTLFTAHMGVRKDNAGWRYRVAISDQVAGPFKSQEELELNTAVLGYEIKGCLLTRPLDIPFETYLDLAGKVRPLEDLLREKAELV